MNRQLHVFRESELEPFEEAVRHPVAGWRDYRNKPLPGTGFWTSTWREPFGSAWVDWCEAEEFDYCERWHGVVLTPRSTARIARIDSFADLRRFSAPWRRGLPPSLQDSPALDWQALIEKFDGLHLTEQGQRETRWTNPSLYGWDCESTLWFRWAFEPKPELVSFPWGASQLIEDLQLEERHRLKAELLHNHHTV